MYFYHSPNEFIYRRSWTPVEGDSNRPIKRLFTPEIKRMLKDWLVRRRENPYPSRNEKKLLAEKTGLTYIQVRDYGLTCNSFMVNKFIHFVAFSISKTKRSAIGLRTGDES